MEIPRWAPGEKYLKSLGWLPISKSIIKRFNALQELMPSDSVLDALPGNRRIAGDDDFLTILHGRMKSIQTAAKGRQVWFVPDTGWDSVHVFFGTEQDIMTKIDAKIAEVKSWGQ